MTTSSHIEEEEEDKQEEEGDKGRGGALYPAVLSIKLQAGIASAPY